MKRKRGLFRYEGYFAFRVACERHGEVRDAETMQILLSKTRPRPQRMVGKPWAKTSMTLSLEALEAMDSLAAEWRVGRRQVMEALALHAKRQGLSLADVDPGGEVAAR